MREEWEVTSSQMPDHAEPEESELADEPIRPATAVGMSADEIELRRELSRRIADASFPATRNDLLRYMGPDQRGVVESRLRMFPPDHSFASVGEVLNAFGGLSTAG
jgi:hypothetical protein